MRGKNRAIEREEIVMKDCFVTARVYPGDTNALVKNLMLQMKIDDPNEAVRRVNSGEWIVRPREQGCIITPPTGARIHPVRMRVHQGQEWSQVVRAGGPNTPDDFKVWKVGNLFPPVGAEVVEEDYVLLNYLKGDGSWDKALAWAEGQGLENTVPREVFALGISCPNLHKELQCDPMYAVATTECTFEGDRSACSVWWDDGDRRASLGWVGFCVNAYDWFVFRKPSVLGH